MFLKNVVDEVFNHDFVMQSSIGSKTKHFHTIDHLRSLTWFCGDCQMWPNQQIRHMAQFWIQHQFRLEVYQIFFKKLIHHLKLIIFHSHHLFSFWVLGSPKWVWTPKKPWTSWNRFRVTLLQWIVLPLKMILPQTFYVAWCLFQNCELFDTMSKR